MQAKITVLAAAIAGLTASAGYGQAADRIDQIVITGSKVPRTITEMTHSVTVVHEDLIEQGGYTEVTEILRKQAGIEFKANGGVGQFNYLKLRGLGADNVLIVIDGVKVNYASSGNTGNLLSQLNPSTIEKIEILRGPQATLYGANSTAGVIAITTKSGSRPLMSATAEAGSMNWLKAGASYRGSLPLGAGVLQHSFNVSQTDSDNVHEFEYFEERSLQAKLGYEVGDWSISGSTFLSDNEFNAAHLDESYCCQTPESAWAYQTPDPLNIDATRQEVHNFTLGHDLTEQLRQNLQIGHTRRENSLINVDNGFLGTQVATHDSIIPGARVGDVLYVYDRNRGMSLTPLDLDPLQNSDVNSRYEDSSTQIDYQWLYDTEAFGLVGGIEYQEQSASQSGTYGSSKNEDSQVSYYTNGHLDLAQGRLVLSLGLRLDDYESWGRQTTGNIGMSWNLSDTTTIYGNVGTSFKPATMSQLFNPVYGSASIMPETGRTGEIGLRQTLFDSRLSAEATYWHTEIDDVIFYDNSIANPRSNTGFGQYNNGSNAESKGLELSLSYALTETLSLDGNYTYTDSRQRAVGADWIPTVQIARDKGNLGLTYQNDRLNIGVNAYYAGPRLRWAGDVYMPDYVRVDSSVRYQVNDRLTLGLRVENLFDEEIIEGLGYEEPGRYAVFSVSYQTNL